MSRAMIREAGTGVSRGVAGVKTAKLCAEQDQIGEHEAGVFTLASDAARARSRVDRLRVRAIVLLEE